MFIRPESIADKQAVRLVNEQAFATTLEADLVDALRDGNFIEVSLVAEVENEVVEHILFSKLSIITKNKTIESISLAPMAVLTRFQNQGIGTKLVNAGLEACRQRGQTIAVVLGHPDFYTRFGFSSELALQLESVFDGDDAWMAIELVPGSLNGVEGRIEFSPPFAGLEDIDSD